MKRRFNLSATQMALLSGLGCPIAASGFFVAGFGRKFSACGTVSFDLLLILSMTLVIVGFVLAFKAASHLRQGVKADRWPHEQVVTLRNLTKSPWWRGLTLAFILVFGLTMVLGLLVNHSSPYQTVGWIGFIFMQGMTALQRAVWQGQPPNSNAASLALNNWRISAPLHSNNWGQR